MTDEQLIEKAAKAMADAEQASDDVSWPMLARAALAVFVEAHAPTNDERTQEDRREAARELREVGRDENGQGAPGFAERERRAARAWEFFTHTDREMSHEFRSGYHQGVIDEARRSVVPEPSAEEWAARAHAARKKAIAKGYTPDHDAEHGIRHLLNWAIDYARRGRAEDSSGLILSALALLDAEPQAEPSDALTIPRPHVPFGRQGIPEHVADADYLDHAASNLEGHYEVGGSNVRATVVKLLRDTAAALRASAVQGENRG